MGYNELNSVDEFSAKDIKSFKLRDKIKKLLKDINLQSIIRKGKGILDKTNAMKIEYIEDILEHS